MTTITYSNAAKAVNAARRTPIRAELAGSDICTAAGISARAPTPVLTLCRKLIDAGLDQDRPLEVYRGAVLALRVRSIGEGARLTVNDDRSGRPKLRRFKAPAGDVAALPIAPIRAAGQSVHRRVADARHGR